MDGCTGEELGLFGSLFVSLLGGDGEKRQRRRRKGGEGRGGEGWVPSSCQRSRLMEEVQNKLFHSDELENFPVHLQTFAAEVADAESRLHS